MISIVLATYNERECILAVIDACIKYTRNLKEIIVVDDDSPDRTWELVQDLHRPKVRVIRRIGKKSLPSAIFRGIKESRGDIVIWMDCDFCHHPKNIPSLIRALRDADVAVASRYTEGGRDLRSRDRVFTSWLVNSFASLLFLTEVRDWTSGFVAAKKKVFDKVLINTKGYGEYCIEFLYTAMKEGFSIKEVPYDFGDRKLGVSKTAVNVLSFSMLRHGIFYPLRALTVKLRYLSKKTPRS